jgi:hypothetical protein
VGIRRFISDLLPGRNESAHHRYEENIAGRHALFCSSYLWRFPIHVGYALSEGTDTVFRYSEGSPEILSHESYCQNPRIYFDSLWFRTDSGLTEWRWEHCIDYLDFGGEAFGSARLISAIITSVDEPVSLPSRTRLITNYPNPFNGTTTIGYDLEKGGPVSLTLYDMNGRLILSVDEGYKNPGNHSITLKEEGLSSGVYFVQLQTTDVIQVGRLIYLR